MPLGAVETSIAALKAKQVDAVVLSTEAALASKSASEGRMLSRHGSIRAAFHHPCRLRAEIYGREQPGGVERFLKGFFAAIAFMKTHRRNIGAGRTRAASEPTVVGKDYDFEAGMFIVDGRFDPQAVAALKQSFVDMGTLPTSRRTT